MPVQPQRHAALHALKGDEHTLTAHRLRQGEVLHIAGHGVELLRDLARLHGLAAIPRILDIGVLRHAVALHLDVSGHGDLIPRVAVKVRALKTRQHLRGVFGVVEFPQPVQRGAQAVFPSLQLRPARKALVVGMGGHAVLREKCGAFQLAFIKAHNAHKKGCM